jgi:hypothetical protein
MQTSQHLCKRELACGWVVHALLPVALVAFQGCADAVPAKLDCKRNKLRASPLLQAPTQSICTTLNCSAGLHQLQGGTQSSCTGLHIRPRK